MTIYADLYRLSEDDRIKMIGETAESGKRVAFVVDDAAKANRYMVKLTERFKVTVEQQFSGPIKGAVTVIVTKREETHESRGTDQAQ